MNLTITNPGKINGMPSYRSIYLCFFALFVAAGTKAQPHLSLTHNDHKEIKISGDYQHIEVWGNVTVLITDAPSDKLVLEGNPKDLNLVKTRIHEGRLEINAAKKRSFSKLIIYVPAKNVKSVFVNGDAEILGAVKTDDLKILVNGTSKVRVRYSGNLKVIPGDGYDLLEDTDQKN